MLRQACSAALRSIKGVFPSANETGKGTADCPPCKGGVATPLRKWCEATEAALTGKVWMNWQESVWTPLLS